MKKYYLLSLMLVSAVCSAEDYVVMKANDDFNRNLVAFTERNSECKASAVVLPSDVFSNVKIGKEEQKVALQYHHFKALYECTDDAMKDYLLSSSVLAALADKERAQSVYESSQLIIDAKLHMLKAEAKYQKL